VSSLFITLEAKTDNTQAAVQILVACNIATNYPEGDVHKAKAQLALDSCGNNLDWAKKHNPQLILGTVLLNSREAQEQ
jgi:hypothetical protein